MKITLTELRQMIKQQLREQVEDDKQQASSIDGLKMYIKSLFTVGNDGEKELDGNQKNHIDNIRTIIKTYVEVAQDIDLRRDISKSERQLFILLRNMANEVKDPVGSAATKTESINRKRNRNRFY